MRPRVFVDCWHCAGRGRLELTSPLADTLATLREDDWTSTDDVVRELAVARTTVINRLNRLAEHGVILRRSSRHSYKALEWRRQKRRRRPS
jgi:predicted transcriptional regulator